MSAADTEKASSEARERYRRAQAIAKLTDGWSTEDLEQAMLVKWNMKLANDAPTVVIENITWHQL